MSVTLKRSQTAEWQVGYPGMDDLDMPHVEILKKAKTALIIDGENFGIGLEKYPASSFDCSYECDEVYYLISGGPAKITCEGKTVEQNPGDFIYITRGSDIHFEIANEMYIITFVYPSLGEIVERYREKYKKGAKD